MSVYIGSYNKKNMKKHVAETDTSDNRKGNATPAASNGGISIANGAAVKKRATGTTDVGASFIDRRTNPYADAIKKYDEQKSTKQTYNGSAILGQKTPFVTAQTIKKESDPLYKATTQKKKETGGVGGRLVHYPTNETLTFSEFKDRYGEKNADANYNDYLSGLSTPMLEAVQRKNENTGDANNVARSAAGKVVRHITDFVTGNGEAQKRYEESANKIDNYLSARKNQEALESIDADTEKLLSAYFNEESKDDPTNQFAIGLIEGEGYSYTEQKNRSLMEEIRNAVAEKGLDFDTVYAAYSAERNAGRRKNIEDQNKALAEEHPVLSSLYQPFVGVAGGIASLSRGMSDFTGYQGADNSFRFTDAANAQRQVVSENVSNELYKRTGSKTIADIGGFAYGIGESLLQSGIALGVGASTGLGSLGSALLGLSAGADAYRKALDNGISEDSAALTGMAAGTAETLFEAVSLSIALEQFMTPGMSLFDFVKNIVLQGIGEASEEGATDIANYATDYIINGELSEIKQRIDYYKSKGAIPEEAARLTAKDFAKQIGEDMLAGFISGGISSTAEQGAGAAIRKVTVPNAYVRGEKIKYDRAGSKNNTIEGDYANQNVDIIDENGNIVNYTEPDNTAAAADTDMRTYLLEAAREAAQREAQKSGSEKTVEYFHETPVKSEDSTETIQREEAAETPSYEEKTEEKNTSGEPSARKIASVNRIKGEAVITVELSDGRKVTSDKANYADDEQKTLFEGLAKNKDYSVTDINTLIRIKDTVPEMDAETFVSAANEGYGYGAGGLKREYIRADAAFNELPEATKELIYDLGANARTSRDTARSESIRKSAKGTTESWRGGTVKARDKSVTIDSLKKTFNDAQNIAYKVLSFYADATGIDIDLYASEPNEAGEYTAAQGEYNRSTRRIAIDINAGLRYGNDVNSLGKYTALRTFGHEIVHFSKDFAPEETSELESAVFDYLESKGTSTADLIDDLMMKDNRLSYTDASQEVVAEGLADALGESDFVENLCKEHRSLAQKIADKLKEFIAMLKNAWAKLNKSSYAATNGLKEEVNGEIQYAENILKKYNTALKTAVENYQRTFMDETVTEKTADEVINTTEESTVKGDEEKASVEEKNEETVPVEKTEAEDFSATEAIADKIIKQTKKDESTFSATIGKEYFAGNGYVIAKVGKQKFLDLMTVVTRNSVDLPLNSDVNKLDGPAYRFLDKNRKILVFDIPGIDYTVAMQEQFARYFDGYDFYYSKTQFHVKDKDGNLVGVIMPIRVNNVNFEKLPVVKMKSFQSQTSTNSKQAESKKEIVSKNKVGDYIRAIDGTIGKVKSVYDGGDGSVWYSAETENGDRFSVPERNAINFNAQAADINGFLDTIGNKAQKTRAKNKLTLPEYNFIKGLADNADTYAKDISNVKRFGNQEKTVHEYRVYGVEKDAPTAFKELDKIEYDFYNYLKGNEGGNDAEIRESGGREQENRSDNGGAVLQPAHNRAGASRLLDEQQAADVQGAGTERNAVEPVEAGERQTGRNDNGADTADRTGGRDGNSEERDLRRDAELNEEAAELPEVVEEEISQKSTEEPKGNNFVIGDSLDLPSGEKARFRTNVDAIRLIAKLEAENRFATAEEQTALSKYVGWGGLSNAFGEMVFNRESRKNEMRAKSGWENEFNELRSLVDEGIITEDEYKAMSASTVNAHYTSIDVIKGMYTGLKMLGYTGGRMLEPSSGVGNFVGAMPSEMTAGVKSWTMVELDRVTGLIAKYLYPHSDVRIEGFQNTLLPDNYIDVAIGNVPFGNANFADRKYPSSITKALHNYFFAKSLDVVRPGGLVMFITSSFTMNAENAAVRQYLANRADLIGAIRLPNNAFKGNAGTEVVTDILVFKKRKPNTPYTGEAFINSPRVQIGEGYYQAANINEYFNTHPEMVLGTPEIGRGMYGSNSLTYNALEGKGTLREQIENAFKNISVRMEYPAAPAKENINAEVSRKRKSSKNGSFVVNADGTVSRNENGELKKIDADDKTVKRITGMVKIRDGYIDLTTALIQDFSEETVKTARKKLNAAYDSFVKEYGYINSRANVKILEGSSDEYSLRALEKYDAKTKTAEKADIFTRNTIAPNKTITHVDTIEDGISASINTKGAVDASYIAEITGIPVEQATKEMLNARLVFKNTRGMLESREQYLSGNVRAKLREAKALVSIDSAYKLNVEELEKVIPEDISYDDIFVTPGSPWIPTDVYADFITHILGGYKHSYGTPDVEVARSAQTGEFKIQINNKRLLHGYNNTQEYGTSRKTFKDIIETLMDGRTVRVNDTIEDENGTKRPVLNKEETTAAQAKADKISAEFRRWLWDDNERRAELSKLYNETFNAIVPPLYDGKNITVNGLNADFSLREHQANVVQRIIMSGGNTLIAHKVGAGKTLEMAAAAMKMRETGIVKKPLFIVPKSLVSQWGTEFQSYFPAAKLLVSGDKSFSPANRKTFMNRIANGDYDAVIVSYEQFEKVPMSQAYRQRFYEEMKAEILAAIAEEKAEKGEKGLTVKQMQDKVNSIEKKISELTTKAKDEDNITFEMLGIDGLFVDEAHNFKNLEYTTKMMNVAGLGNSDGSQRAFDLYTKIRYLQELNGGRGIVFATATPVMNSMAEMYIMQKYLQSDTLKQLGLVSFDAWAKQFGEVVNGYEIAPSGKGFRMKQSFSNFKNLPELQMLFRNFTDVLTEVPGLKIPKLKDGKVKIVESEPSDFQKQYMESLAKRAENVRNVDPSVDNMLKITSDGRKISYTQRMIDPSLPYEPKGKIYSCGDNIVAEYKASKKIKGTQIVFMDMATPKGKSAAQKNSTETEVDNSELDLNSAQLYDVLKAYLIKKGIPANEIVFIHDAKNDAQRKQLFSDMNEGKVRVLIGSTGKMGVGMNAQKRVVAIHHLDAPWRPGDVEQRDGRAFRQKNMNEYVSKYVYVTKGSFDARLWDILDRKSHFINQIMNGDNAGRTAEETGEVVLSAAEIKAIASDDPRIMEQVKLKDEIDKLSDLEIAYEKEIATSKKKLVEDNAASSKFETMIESAKLDIKARKDGYSDNDFRMTVGKKTVTDKKEAGQMLFASVLKNATAGTYTKIGGIAGFDISVLESSASEYKGLLTLNGRYNFNVYTANTTMMVNRICAIIANLPETLKSYEAGLSEIRKDIKGQNEILSRPFEHRQELTEKRARYTELMAELNPKEEQLGNDDVQEQGRFFAEDDIADDNIVDLTNETTLKEIIGEATGAEKYKLIQKYILDNIGNGVVFPDGVYVIVDKSDAMHIANKSMDKKTAEISAVKSLINASVIYAEDNKAEHLKFKRFIYYKTNVKFEREFFPIYFNIGLGKNDNKLHLYDITNRIRDTADRINGLERLREFRSVNGIPTKKISQLGKNVNTDLDTQNQPRTETYSDREILEMAANETSSDEYTAEEKNALSIFRSHAEKLDELEDERAEQGRLYVEQQFSKNSNRAEAQKTKNRMDVLDGQIQREEEALLSIENKKVLKDILKKARRIIEKKDSEKTKEALKRYRDRRDNSAKIKKYRERIQKNVNDLSAWVLNPNNKEAVKHIPEIIRNDVIGFLTSIDFTSKRQLSGKAATKADAEFANRLERLRSAIRENVSVNGLYSGYNDLPEGFLSGENGEMGRLDRHIEKIMTLLENGEDGYIINRMTSDELKELSEIVENLKAYVQNMNAFLANEAYQHVYEAGDNTVEYLRSLGDDSSRRAPAELAYKTLEWDMIRPAYGFERFGEGGKAIEAELRNGQATLAFNADKIIKFAEETYTAEEVQKWENELNEFVIDGDTVIIPTSYLMGLYELMKQLDSREHIAEGGGIRVAVFTRDKKKHADAGHKVSLTEIANMLNVLTDRQKEVADALQKYMATQGAEWLNYVSVKRFGTLLATNEQYYPINSDGRRLSATADEAPSNASLYALLNSGFTKSRVEGANNRVMLYSIFDVFSNHMASTAQYNAFALPILDAIKWLNYKTDAETEINRISLRDKLARVYGVPEERGGKGGGNMGYAEAFIKNVIKAYNGTEAQGIPEDASGIDALHRYNVAQVAFNFRVVVQQPLAITRAGEIINYSDIIQALSFSPAAVKNNIEEMYKYSGIAKWKSLGFYDINISRGLTDLIKHDTGKIDKINEVGMAGAEKMDELTWSAIWNACKKNVSKTKKYAYGSEEYFKAVTKLFDEVIYKTQVVDSVLTKPQYMRSKGFRARLLGSFMAEPLATVSMLTGTYDKYREDIRKGKSRAQAWKNNKRKIGRLALVYGLTAVLNAAVTAVIDAFRDDDDDEWYKKFLENFGSNINEELNPLNKIPGLSQFVELFKSLLAEAGFDTYGNAAPSVIAQWSDAAAKAVKIIVAKSSNESTGYTWYAGIYALLQFASGLTGLPLSAATRTAVNVWNNTVGYLNGKLKFENYVSSEERQNKIYNAIVNGDDKYLDKLKTKYKTESGYKTAVSKGLYQNDERITDAAKALADGDYETYNRYFYDIAAENLFEESAIKSAINLAMNDMGISEDEAEEETPWYDEKNKSGKKKYTDYSSLEMSDIHSAFDAGNDENGNIALAEVMQGYILAGKSKEDAKSAIQSSATSYWKPIYVEAHKANDTEEMKRIRKILAKYKVYKDVSETCLGWIKAK